MKISFTRIAGRRNGPFCENQPAGERHDYRQDPFDCTVQAEKGFDEGELDFLELWLLSFKRK